MPSNSLNSGFLSISVYFVLNLLVTLTSKQLISQIQGPWLLTASHAATTYIVTGAVLWVQRCRSESRPSGDLSPGAGHDNDNENGDKDQYRNKSAPLLLEHLRILLPFSILYTMNIAMSNWTLGLVSLTMHQVIRASVPAITVFISIAFLGKPWKEYALGAYGAIATTICGVMLATTAASSTGKDKAHIRSSTETAYGFTMTFLSATVAVVKTILTNQLQRSSRATRWGLGLSSTALLRYLSLYAFSQTAVFASWTGESERLRSRLGSPNIMPRPSDRLRWAGSPWIWLWFLNAFAASWLNIASFEANKRCGPLSMGVAGNFKQIAILLLAFFPRGENNTGGDRRAGQEAGTMVIVGSLMTVIGGVWYAFAKAAMDKSQRRLSTEDALITSNQGWGG